MTAAPVLRPTDRCSSADRYIKTFRTPPEWHRLTGVVMFRAPATTREPGPSLPARAGIETALASDSALSMTTESGRTPRVASSATAQRESSVWLAKAARAVRARGFALVRREGGTARLVRLAPAGAGVRERDREEWFIGAEGGWIEIPLTNLGVDLRILPGETSAAPQGWDTGRLRNLGERAFAPAVREDVFCAGGNEVAA